MRMRHFIAFAARLLTRDETRNLRTVKEMGEGGRSDLTSIRRVDVVKWIEDPINTAS